MGCVPNSTNMEGLSPCYPLALLFVSQFVGQKNLDRKEGAA